MEKPHPHCPVIDVNGLVSKGKEFDLDINIPEDNRDIIFGTIKDCYKEPLKNAVVKLIEIDYCKQGKKRRLPVSHTFTNKYGEFVFGPLCPGKEYALDIWVNDIRNYKICIDADKCDDKCLKGKNQDKCNCHNTK